MESLYIVLNTFYSMLHSTMYSILHIIHTYTHSYTHIILDRKTTMKTLSNSILDPSEDSDF